MSVGEDTEAGRRVNQYVGAFVQGATFRGVVVRVQGDRLERLASCDHKHRTRVGAMYCAVALAEERSL